MKKVIFFDLDDTLYDYGRVHEKAMSAVYTKLKKKISISKKEFDSKFLLSKGEIHRELSGTASSHNRILYFQRLIEKTHRTVHPEDTLELYAQYWETLLKHSRPKKGVIKTMKELKKMGFKIGIITGLTTHIQLRKVSVLGLTDYVDVFVSSEEAGREKPHPSPFLIALNKVGALPSEALMVGDNLKKDIEGSMSVGIAGIHLTQNPAYKEHKPDFHIKEISEVLKIVKDFNQ